MVARVGRRARGRLQFQQQQLLQLADTGFLLALLLTGSGAIIMAPALYRAVPYDVARGTVSVTLDDDGSADPVSTTITSSTASSATSYTAQDGSTAHTYPATISSPTTFWLASTGTYSVSAVMTSGPMPVSGAVSPIMP